MLRRFATSPAPLACALLAFAHGCDESHAYAPPDPATCAVYLWEPGDGELETWPAMEYLAEDSSTATGYSFDLPAARYPALATFGNHAAIAESQLPTIDGFGIHGALYAQFSRSFDPAALPVADGAAHASDPVGVVVFAEDGSASLLPVSLTTVPDRVTDEHLLVATPMVPLPERTWAAFFVTDDAAAASTDGCVATSVGMRARVDHPAEHERQAIDALVALGVIEDARELVVLQPFVTQSVTAVSRAIAADVASRPDEDFVLTVDEDADCTEGAKAKHCVGALTVTDYRDEHGYVALDASGAPVRHATYTLDVHMWIPLSITGPTGAFVIGHGIGGSVAGLPDLAPGIFDGAADRGMIILGIDALEHGTHPTADSTDAATEVMNFFAVNLETNEFDALRVRGNLQQSTYDKLQLTRAILAHPDLDGDGTDDLDPARLAYVGVSLGAVMGPELLALTDAYQSTVLAVPGGRLSEIVNDPLGKFSSLKTVLLPVSTKRSPAEVLKLFAILQTALDRGDSASYAPHLLRDRFDGTPAPDVLVTNVIGDKIIPNPENWYFARALGVPIGPVVLEPVPGLATVDTAPFSANLETPSGSITAGLLQFDRMENFDGTIAAATHGEMAQSLTSAHALFEFLTTKWEDGRAVIEDPYAATGLAHGTAP